MIVKSISALGAINKAWAAAIAAPLAEWVTGLAADAMWAHWRIAMPDSAELAIVSLIVGLVVYCVPNLSSEQLVDATEKAGA